MAGACIKNSGKTNSEARVEMVNRSLRRRPGRSKENWLRTVSKDQDKVDLSWEEVAAAVEN